MGDYCPIQPSKGAMTPQAARMKAAGINMEARKLFEEGKYEEGWKLQEQVPRAASSAQLPGERGGSTYRRDQILVQPNEEKKDNAVYPTVGPAR